MSLLHAFREEVEAHLTKTGLTATAFGIAALGDPRFVFELREGREPRFGTIDKVRAFIAAAASEAA